MWLIFAEHMSTEMNSNLEKIDLVVEPPSSTGLITLLMLIIHTEP